MKRILIMGDSHAARFVIDGVLDKYQSQVQVDILPMIGVVAGFFRMNGDKFSLAPFHDFQNQYAEENRPQIRRYYDQSKESIQLINSKGNILQYDNLVLYGGTFLLHQYVYKPDGAFSSSYMNSLTEDTIRSSTISVWLDQLANVNGLNARKIVVAPPLKNELHEFSIKTDVDKIDTDFMHDFFESNFAKRGCEYIRTPEELYDDYRLNTSKEFVLRPGEYDHLSKQGSMIMADAIMNHLGLDRPV